MAKQLELRFHGGKRKNAGRKNRTGLAAHAKRPRVDFKKPLHITLKCNPGLRNSGPFRQMKNACRRLKKFGLHVIQFSILNDHIHMIVEARDNEALTKGMQSLTGIFAKLFDRRFKGRYHLTLITTPTQMRNAYRYVILNFAKHEKLARHVDGYSSGAAFPHLARLVDLDWGPEPRTHAHFGITPASSWLARTGWMRAARARI